MSEVIKLLMKSDDYLLGRVQEKATHEELEFIVRIKLYQNEKYGSDGR